jgi:perosamine synthetase
MLAVKAAVAARYATFFAEAGIPFVQAPPETVSNHWLNAIVLESLAERDAFLEYSNGQGVMRDRSGG